MALILLALSHLLIDMHSSMLPVVLVYQRPVLGLTLTQVGLVAGVYNFGISLAQPLFGYLSDRWGERPFASGSLLWISALGASLGFAPTFVHLLVLAGLQAIAPAAFHPPGAAGVSQLSAQAGKKVSGKRGFSMSFFLSGGSVGMALGPLVAAGVFELAGLRGTAWIGLVTFSLALVLIGLMRLAWPNSGTRNRAIRSTAARNAQVRPHPAVAGAANWRMVWPAVAVLLLITAVRTSIHMSLTTYIPQYLALEGLEPAQASRWLALMLVGTIFGVISGGPLSDRYGPRWVISTALLVLGAALLVLLTLPSIAIYSLLLPIAGAAVGIPLSMTLVIGQAFLRDAAGLASGLVLGTSFVSGALGVTLVGWVGEHWGLGVALSWLGVLALISAVAGLGLPRQVPALQPSPQSGG